MADNNDSTQPNKKITIRDFSGNDSDGVPGTAPELQTPVEGVSDSSDDVKDTTPETDPANHADTGSDSKTDQTTQKDGDEVLQTQDTAAEQTVVMQSGKWDRFKNRLADWWANPRKRWSTIGVIVVVIAAVFGVPYTRYNILGLVLSGDVTVHAVDSKTGKPVSGATVELAGKTAETNAEGVATLKVHAGSKTLQVTKKYYTGVTQSQLVALSGNSFKAALIATGHQVNLKVINKITGKPVTGAVVTSSGASAKTNASGLATLVIASSATKQEASVALAGYNTATVEVTATGDLAKNTFTVTPAGKLYFLSNLSGHVDVVKTNLDGTERAVVLEGTGKEDKNNTSLLASRDWKYLALLAKRSGDKASVYLIDTTNADKLTTIDEGDAQFSLVGWSGSRFIYQVNRNSVSNWQAHQQALKSFDPTTGHSLLLDQTQGSGTGALDYVKQSFGVSYIIGDQIVYVKNWDTSYTTPAQLSDKQATLESIGADGSGHKTVKGFSLDSGTTSSYLGISTSLYEPGGIYVYFASGGKDNFYEYESGKVTDVADLTSDKFYNTPYPTYLLSPSGNSIFWSEQRDGKNALFLGDKDAKNQKQVASLSEYSTYGWYSDDYLLVSKNSSELYVLSTAGGTPQKITDYYKPAINYNGYGGGYGGL